jgi:hypothetical protein
MMPLDVSFGIFAFLPVGWLFMALVIFGEAFLMCNYLIQKKFNKRIYISAAVSNLVSGAVGIFISMALNGGWWLVVWFPWVSSHEVDVHDPKQLWFLVIYYFIALILSIFIEVLVNNLFLRKQYHSKKILNASLIANAFSYALGAIIIIVLCIIPIK